ncbi:hypothetical protein ACFL2R_03445 [Patescibacteria group bacterium]
MKDALGTTLMFAIIVSIPLFVSGHLTPTNAAIGTAVLWATRFASLTIEKHKQQIQERA